MAKFRNSKGKVIETNDPATILSYQTREGFTEVKSSRQSSSDSDSSKSSDKK